MRQLVAKALINSTAHGLQHLGRSESVPRRVFWILVMTIALIPFTYHLVQLTRGYLSAPTVVTETPNAIRFQIPDIYICPSSPLSESYIVQLERTNHSYFTELKATLAWIERTLPLPSKKYDFIKNYLLWHNIPLAPLYQHIGNRIEQTILDLTHSTIIRGQLSLREVVTVIPHPIYLACFRVRFPVEYFNSSEDSLNIYLFNDEIPKSKSSSLTLYEYPLTNYKYQMAPEFYEDMGFTIFFTQRDFFPHSVSTFLQAVPKYSTSVQLKMSSTKVLSKPGITECCSKSPHSVEYLNPLKDDNSFNESVISFADTYNDCLYSYRHSYLLRRCGCTIHGYMLTVEQTQNLKSGNISFCFNLTNILQIANGNLSLVYKIAQKRYKCVLDMGDLFTRVDLRCEQRQPCTMLNYQATWSISEMILVDSTENVTDSMFVTAMQKRIERMEALGYTVPGWRRYITFLDKANFLQALRNTAKVYIYPQNIRSPIFIESWFYTKFRFFSEIGGILGLYMGASFLTFFEVLEFIQDLLARKTKVSAAEDDTEETQC